jgi:hypothetical protein
MIIEKRTVNVRYDNLTGVLLANIGVCHIAVANSDIQNPFNQPKNQFLETNVR